MIVTGQLIERQLKTNNETGKQSAKLQVLFKQPAQLLGVAVSNHQIEQGYYHAFEGLEGKEMEFALKFDELKFQDKATKDMVDMTRMVLDSLPGEAQRALEQKQQANQRARSAQQKTA